MIRDFIKRSLLPLKRKMQLDSGIRIILTGMTLAGGISLIMSLLSLFMVVPFLRVRLLVIIAVCLALSLLVAVCRRHSWKSVLIRADASGLQERVITAWSLEGVESTVAELQRQDTRSVLSSVRPQSTFRIKIEKIFYIPGLVLIMLAFVLSFVPGRFYDDTRTREALISEMKNQEKSIEEKIREEVEKREDLSQTRLKEMQEALEKLKEGFKKAKTEEDALKALAQLENEMKKLETQDAVSDLQALESAMEQSPLTESLADALKKEDPGALDKALEELKKSLESEDNREELNETLKEAMENMGSESALAEALQAIANQASSGNPGASAASGSLSEILQDAVENADSQDAGRQAAGEVSQTTRNARKAIAAVDQQVSQGGQSGAGTSAEGSQSGQSQGDREGQSGQGNQPGNNGSGGSSAQGRGGAGAGQGSTGEDAGYSEGDQAGAGRAPGSRKEEEYQRIYVPDHLGGEGNETSISGQKLESGSSTFNEADGAPVQKGSMLPWQEVLTQYRDEAVQSMEHQEIPAGMKSLVRDYFSSLN